MHLRALVRFELWTSKGPFPFCYEIEQGWLPISEVLKAFEPFMYFGVKTF